MTEKPPNYCHDSDLEQIAKKLGLVSRSIINTALSIGEGMYNGFDVAENFLIKQAEKRRLNKLRQPKTRLSKQQKKENLKRHGQ